MQKITEIRKFYTVKRIVLNKYGNKSTTKQIFIRSISCAVPLDVLSFLGGTGWHDDWNKTFVLRKKHLAGLKLLQQIKNINSAPTQLI